MRGGVELLPEQGAGSFRGRAPGGRLLPSRYRPRLESPPRSGAACEEAEEDALLREPEHERVDLRQGRLRRKGGALRGDGEKSARPGTSYHRQHAVQTRHRKRLVRPAARRDRKSVV